MQEDENLDFKVAVIGLACKLPKAKDVREYWKALLEGKELLTHFSKEEIAFMTQMEVEKLPETLVGTYGFIDDADHFDHAFFNYSKVEALRLDPQHRLFLQACWHALEDAGCDPASYKGRIGVFAGSGPSDHYSHLKKNLEKIPGATDWELRVDTCHDFLVTRVAYKLGLTGPAVAVQTACSTSLVSIHLGVQSLLAGESDMVLAGGVTVSTIPKFDTYDPGGITAKDGHCRPFSKDATGTIGSSGCGVVALKLLSDAIKDGDRIYGVILSSSINNDGNAKMSFSAPSIKGQREAIRRTLENSSIDPSSVGFIETHGTGTILGDPIEVAALNQAYAMASGSKCFLGSVKSNLGHTDTAAGVCGFIKAVLSVYHGEIPPTINYTAPNPNLNLDDTPFVINSVKEAWISDELRRAGVNSLGLGGTNAHVILEEYKEDPKPSQQEKELLFPFSAQGEAQLVRNVSETIDYLSRHPELMKSASSTLQLGRRAFSHRVCILAKTPDELALRLNNNLVPSVHKKNPKACFVFPGQGGQYVEMGESLFKEKGLFQETMLKCFDFFRAQGIDLRDALWSKSPNSDIHQMSFAQAAVFSIEIALGFHYQRLLKGDVVVGLAGHSLGSYAAACLAGVFTLEDACRIVAKRGEIFDKLEEGAMLAVLASQEQIEPILPSQLAIAAVNLPKHIVVSGPGESIQKFSEVLVSMGIDQKKIYVSRAAHSGMLDPYLEEFKSFLKTFQFKSPKIPILSDHTGDWIRNDEFMDAEYWTNHLRQTVRFSDCVEKILQLEEIAVFELGPGKTLSSFIKNHPTYQGQALFQTLAHANEETTERVDLVTIGSAWEKGFLIDWSYLDESGPRRITSVPGYSFSRNKFNILHETSIEIESPGAQSVSGQIHKELDEDEEKVLEGFRKFFNDQLIQFDDNFFDLGGDSLLALRLLRSVRAVFNIDIPLSAILKNPTPRLLAQKVKSLTMQEKENV